MAYVMSVKSPGSVSFTHDEVERIDRAQLAIILHRPPEEIDAMPLRDRQDVLQIYNANRELDAWFQQRRR